MCNTERIAAEADEEEYDVLHQIGFQFRHYESIISEREKKMKAAIVIGIALLIM